MLEGEIELTFRGAKSIVRSDETVIIPANAVHIFQNVYARPVHLLCMCSPAGQEQFFMAVGVPVESHTAPAPKLDEAGKKAVLVKAEALAPNYRTELLKP